MYEAFFGLEELPFSLTPDPRFLWLSDTHQEGLATLYYGITRRKGFRMRHVPPQWWVAPLGGPELVR